MPVTGLPSRLECVLNTFLQEMYLTSFKIDSRDDQTVIVLRLTPTGQPLAHTPTDSAVYRRKSPAQVARDKRRAEVHRTLRTEEGMQASLSSPPSGLFLPTPPSLYYTTQNATAHDTFYATDTYNTAPCVAECARAAQQASQSRDTVHEAENSLLVKTQHMDVRVNDGDDGEKGDDWSEQTEDFADETLAMSQTPTEHTADEALAEENETVTGRGCDVEDTSSVSKSKQTNQLSSDHCRQAIECIEKMQRDMRRMNTSFSSREDRLSPANGQHGNLSTPPGKQQTSWPHR